MRERSSNSFEALLTAVGDAEVFIALLLSTFVFLVVFGIGGGYMLAQKWQHASTPMRIILGGGYAVLMICEIRSLGWISHGLQVKRSPRAVWLAMSLRQRGLWFNLTLAAWWILNLAAILAAGIALDMAISSWGHDRGYDTKVRWMAPCAGVFVLFTATYMSSSFLVLAVGSLWRREELLRKVWRSRALIDAVVVIGVLVVQWLI